MKVKMNAVNKTMTFKTTFKRLVKKMSIRSNSSVSLGIDYEMPEEIKPIVGVADVPDLIDISRFDAVEKTYFPVYRNHIHLMYYSGPSHDTYQYNAILKTNQWKSFFDDAFYKDYIKIQYQYNIGLPLGIVFNKKSNNIITFDNHIELDTYFRTNFNTID